MSLGRLNLAVQFYGCSFTSNRASQGGALMVDFANGLSTTSTTVDIRLVNCTVTKNNAQTDGGSVYAGSHNVLTLSGVQLTRNVAGGRGGAGSVAGQHETATPLACVLAAPRDGAVNELGPHRR